MSLDRHVRQVLVGGIIILAVSTRCYKRPLQWLRNGPPGRYERLRYDAVAGIVGVGDVV